MQLFTTHRSIFRLALGLLAIAVSAAQPLEAQLPVVRLTTLSPPGGTRGTTFDMTIAGSDIDEVTEILFSHPGIRAEAKFAPSPEHAELLKESPRRMANQFQVTIGKDVAVGIYEVRSVGLFGISNPVAFHVSSLLDAREKESNELTTNATEIALGSVVSGSIGNGADVDHFRFEAKKGQRVIVDCYAFRIDSQLSPVVAVLDSTGNEIGRSRVERRRDAVVDVTVPEDGFYFAQVRDKTFRGGGDYFYRLQVHAGTHVDAVYPPVVQQGVESEVTVLGRNLPGGKANPALHVRRRPLEELSVRISAPGSAQLAPSGVVVESRDFGLRSFPYRLGRDDEASCAQLVGVTPHPVVLETPENDLSGGATKASMPSEVVGRFWPRRDTDWISFEAKKDQEVHLEVTSQRLGLRTDPVMTVYQVQKGKDGEESLRELVHQDDGIANIGGGDFNTGSSDPTWRLKAPADGEYRVRLRDLYHGTQSDPRNVWRLSLREPTPDFHLIATPNFPAADQKKSPGGSYTPFVRRGETERIKVFVQRVDGFAAPVEITVEGLSKGVAARPLTIGGNSGTLELVCDKEADAMAGPIRVIGKAKHGDRELSRVAIGGARIGSPQRARTSSQVVFGVSAHESLPLAIAPKSVLETARGAKVELVLALERGASAMGKVTIEGQSLPKDVQLKKFTVDDKAPEGKVTLEIKNNAPVGEHRFTVRGDTELQYRRNLPLLERAQKRQEEIDALAKQLSERQAKAMKDVETTKTAESEASKAVATAEQAHATAKKQSEDMSTELAAARKRLDEASAALAKQPTNEQLVLAKSKADEACKSSETKVQQARAEFESSSKTVESAKKALEGARSAQANAAKALAEVAPLAQAAKASFERAKSNLAEAGKVNTPAKRNLRVTSSSVTIRILPAPFRLDTSAVQQGASLARGTSLEVPLSIERLFGFEDEVIVRATLPKGVAGLKASELKIPKGAPSGNLIIEAAKETPEGAHEIALRVQGKFSGLDQAIDAKLTLNVTAPPADEPKTPQPESPKTPEAGAPAPKSEAPDKAAGEKK